MVSFVLTNAPIVVALFVVLSALALPPAQLATRGLLRVWAGPDTIRARAPAVVLGMSFGAATAIILAAVVITPQAALFVALLVLLALLATIDVVWRWLPLEWCALIAVLGAALASLNGDFASAGLGALAGGGLLLALRATYQVLRGVEGLGLGDVWLAAAIGVIVGPLHIIWILGAAACLGIVLSFASTTPIRARMGVAFGAHICVVTPFFLGL